MKIVINAVSAKMGGAVTYIINVLHRLSAVEGDLLFLVFLPPETAAKLEVMDRNIKVITTPIGHAGVLKRMWWEQITLRRFLKEQRVEALFSTANFGMLHCPVRQILLVRNALYFSRIYRDLFLSRHSLADRLAFWLRRWLICQSARTADVVMTPTKTMLDELTQCVSIAPWRTLVNHYGVPTRVLSRPERKEVSEPVNFSDSELTKLLYVSYYFEHKNLTTLLKAVPALNRNSGKRFVLKTTADPRWEGCRWTGTRPYDLMLMRKPEVGKWVEIIGLQNRQNTAQLYAEADVFVFPSLAESFGFPMVEAMLFGVPIVAADTSVNREVCGDAALYFSPLAAGDLAQKVKELAADHDLYVCLREAGRRRVRNRFDWSEHVRRLIDVTGTLERKGRLLNEHEGGPDVGYRSV